MEFDRRSQFACSHPKRVPLRSAPGPPLDDNTVAETEDLLRHFPLQLFDSLTSVAVPEIDPQGVHPLVGTKAHGTQIPFNLPGVRCLARAGQAAHNDECRTVLEFSHAVILAQSAVARGRWASALRRPADTIKNMRFCLLAALCLFSVYAQVKPKTAFDKPSFETYVRHLLLVDPRVEIKVDDPKSSTIGNLKELDVHMSYQGRTQDEIFYVSPDGQQVVYGKVFDVNHSPFQKDLDKIHTEGAPILGAANAPLTIVLYSDFQCPACKEEAKMLRDNIVQTYPTQVHVYFRDFPLEQIHPWAKAGAIAGRCVYRQNASSFWDYYDWMYEHQTEVTPENLKDKVLEFAKNKNLDTLQLGRCMDTKATEEDVNKSLAEGKSLIIDQTPTMFINGRRIPGSIPWPNLKQLLDAELEYSKPTAEACCEVKIPTAISK